MDPLCGGGVDAAERPVNDRQEGDGEGEHEEGEAGVARAGCALGAGGEGGALAGGHALRAFGCGAELGQQGKG